MKLDDLRPAPYNPRTIDDAALSGLKRSIGEFGDISGIVWNRRTGHLVCGHQRLEAMKEEHGDQLRLVRISKDGPRQFALDAGNERFPIRVVDWDEAHEKAANVTANNPQIAGIFTDTLGDLLSDVDESLHDLMGPLRLDELFGPEDQEAIQDEVPEPPDEAITQPGDLWVLGDHRLLCGDSSSETDVDRLLDGQPIHLVNTDPPYNVKVEPRSNNAIAAGLSSFRNKKAQLHHQGFDVARQGPKKATHSKMRAKDRPLENDFVSDEEFECLLQAWFGTIARVLAPGRAFYIWGGYANVANYPPVLKTCGLYFAQSIIWHKQWPVLTRKDFMGDHEWCFYGWKEGAAHVFLGPDNIADVWSVKKVTPQSMVHLTEKPVELAVRAMQYSSRVGEKVLDLFGGSGSTLIAAEQTRRHAFLVELDPLYCDVIVQRWETFTGGTAKRVSASSARSSGKAQANTPRGPAKGSGKRKKAPAHAQ